MRRRTATLAASICACALLCPAASADDAPVVQDLGVVAVRDKYGYPRPTTRLGDAFVFSVADAASGVDPWITDGTPAGTRRLVDFDPGSATTDFKISGVAGGRVIFTADIGENSIDHWSFDPATGTLERLTDFRNPASSVLTLVHFSEFPFAAVGDRGVFGVEGEEPVGGLWTTDGTAAGTKRLETAGAVLRYTASPPWIYGLGDLAVVFPGGDSEGWAGWTTDGTPEGRKLLGVPSLRSGESMQVVGRTLFYVSDEGLWATDGVSGHERRVFPAAALFGGTRWPPLTSIDGRLFFWDATRRLVVVDAKEPFGSRPLPFRGGRDADSMPLALAASGPRVFASLVARHGRPREVWASEVGAPKPHVVRTRGGRRLRASGPMLSLGDTGRVVFGGPPTKEGAALWISDGTRRGTRPLAVVAPASDSTDVVPALVLGDRVLCTVRDAETNVSRLVAVELPR